MNDASIMELFRNRDENALKELKSKYDGLCCYIAGNILFRREDAEECVNSAYYDIWNRIPPEEPRDLKTYLLSTIRHGSAARSTRYRWTSFRSVYPTGAATISQQKSLRVLSAAF